ncbi:MAG TPA: hypothetical protein VL486_07685 [Verrucomicrobiae bacterium]|nr:hypothetical protein [Verrucomicrobiae bacterium]
MAIVVYSGLAVYSILAGPSGELRFWNPNWVAKQDLQAKGAPQVPHYWSPDSVWYAELAKNLLNHHRFSRQTEPPYLWEPYRTPGYPVLVALGQMMTGHEWGVLLFNPLFAVLMLWSIVGLAHELWRNGAVTRLSGWLTIFLPPCLGWSEFLLTDYVHGCLTVTAFYLTVVAVRRAKWSYGIGAALAWSACQWIRPTSEMAAVFIILIAVWEARRRPQFLLTGFLIAASFLTPLYLCYRMFHDYGVFTVSLLGRHVTRYHLVSVAEAMATGQSESATLKRSFETDAELIAEFDPQRLAQDRSVPPTSFGLELLGGTRNLTLPLYDVQGEAIRDALKKYPRYLVIAYGKGFFSEALWAPWGSPFRWENPQIRTAIAHLMRLAYWLFLALALVATWEVIRHGNSRGPLIIWLSSLFWVAAASIAAAGGSRYRFPGDLLLIPLVACGWMVLAHKLGSYTELGTKPHGEEPTERDTGHYVFRSAIRIHS